MNLKIINTTWFTEMNSPKPIGIVLCKDVITNEPKLYIGTGSGYSEKSDSQSIIENGAKLHISTLEYILNQAKAIK